jgi:hypothetical protein
LLTALDEGEAIIGPFRVASAGDTEIADGDGPDGLTPTLKATERPVPTTNEPGWGERMGAEPEAALNESVAASLVTEPDVFVISTE